MNNKNKTAESTFFAKMQSRKTSIGTARPAVINKLALLVLFAIPGCAAFHPMDGVPARFVPEQFRSPTRSGKQTIDLSRLRQNPPAEYLLDSGDILAVYIENVLGRRDEVPPVYFPDGKDDIGSPALGYPIPVRPDGYITLPMSSPIYVRGITVGQLEQKLRHYYTTVNKQVAPGRERIFVSLQKPRQYRVLVIRQEAGNDIQTSGGGQGQFNLGVVKRGTGQTVTLPAYENDVLHALAASGGLPGLDAENAIYIVRRRKNGAEGCPCQMQSSPLPATPILTPEPERTIPNAQTMRYPVPNSHIQLTSGQQLSQQPVDQRHSWGGFVTYPASSQQQGNPQLGYHDPLAVPGATTPGGPVTPNNGMQPQYQMQMPLPSQTPVASGNQVYPQMAVPSVQPSFEGQPVMEGQTLGASCGCNTLQTGVGTMEGEHVIKIPVRLGPDDRPQFDEKDVILEDGDIVFIESRETEIFYTGGLLGGGQFTLPRDYDLDVLGAISIAQSQGQNNQQTRAIGGVSALNSDVTISASEVIILRQLPNGTQFPIKVNLYNAMRNPEDRIMIQPGDYIMLQYTKMEAWCAFIERHLVEGALFGIAGAQLDNNNN